MKKIKAWYTNQFYPWYSKTWVARRLVPWFVHWKVLIIGLGAAIAMPIQDLIQNGQTPSTKILVWSGVIAAASYLARNLRGQWSTIMGIVSTWITTYWTHNQAGIKTTWLQLILQAIGLYFAAVMPPAKSIGYEQSPPIEKAKQEGEDKVTTMASPNPPSAP